MRSEFILIYKGRIREAYYTEWVCIESRLHKFKEVFDRILYYLLDLSYNRPMAFLEFFSYLCKLGNLKKQYGLVCQDHASFIRANLNSEKLTSIGSSSNF